MPTIVARLTVETSESLARRVVSRTYASWAAANYSRQVVSIAPGASVVLPAATTFVVEADSVARVTLSWGTNSTMPLSGLAVVTISGALTMTNGAPAGSPPVPVAVVSFS